MNSAAFTKRISSGQPTKYNKDKHIAILYDIFSRGDCIADFCAEAFISKQTFYNWLESHREFKEAYEIVLNFSERRWMKYPLELPNINYGYWQSNMRNRFGYNKSTYKFNKDRTPSNIVDSALDSLESGEINAQEAVQLTNLALAKMNIQSSEEIDTISKAKESRESLLDKIDKIQQIIDHSKGENK